MSEDDVLAAGVQLREAIEEAPVSEAEENARDEDAGIARARARNAYTPLGRQLVREDILKGVRYNLRESDRAELLAMLDALDKPARRRGAA